MAANKPTAADHYRALAAEGLTPAEIVRMTGADRRAVHAALKASGKRGRPRSEYVRVTRRIRHDDARILAAREYVAQHDDDGAGHCRFLLSLFDEP